MRITPGLQPDAEAQRQARRAKERARRRLAVYTSADFSALVILQFCSVSGKNRLDAETIATRREAPWRCAENRRWCTRHRGLTWGGWEAPGFPWRGARGQESVQIPCTRTLAREQIQTYSLWTPDSIQCGFGVRIQ